jgi:hypothetical protein
MDPALQGLDPARLRLEARFSFEKRIAKIHDVFPRTFEFLGNRADRLVRAFVDACPPADIARLANAEQFHGFLRARWRHTRPRPTYLRDVASCELAMARARGHAEEPGEREDDGRRGRGFRRRPGVVLLRCRYDVRPVFEGRSGSEVRRRDTRLAIAVPPGADEPRIFEVLPVVFELLAALEDWTDPAAVAAAPALEALVRELAEHGLVEVGA